MGIKIGDNNKIKNSTLVGGSQFNISSSNEETKKRFSWVDVWQSVISRFIWWIILFIIGVIVAIIKLI
jgi:hypothetical protein